MEMSIAPSGRHSQRRRHRNQGGKRKITRVIFSQPNRAVLVMDAEKRRRPLRAEGISGEFISPHANVRRSS
jgi:hypothetical protein